MDIKVFGVVGAGQMGNGIAQVAAASGLDVIMNDIKDVFVENGMRTIAASLDRGVAKGRMTAEEKGGILGRIKTSTDLNDMARADFVVEAATEREDLKFAIFRDLDQRCPAHTILATNTSSIPIGRIAAQTGRPAKVIGMHFMNPVPVMKLVEIIPDAALAVDQSGQIVNSNARVAQLFGYQPADLIGKPIEVLIPEQLREVHCAHRLAYNSDPAPRKMGRDRSFRALRADGEAFDAEVSLSPLVTGQGLLVIAAVRDISPLKRAQQELEDSSARLRQTVEEQTSELLTINAELRREIGKRLQIETDRRITAESYRQLVENQPDLICRFLPDTTLTFVNRAYARMFGREPEQLIGKRFMAALYDGHAYGIHSGGTKESLSQIKIDDLKRFHRQYYAAANAVVAIVGALDRTQAEQMAAANLALGRYVR